MTNTKKSKAQSKNRTPVYRRPIIIIPIAIVIILAVVLLVCIARQSNSDSDGKSNPPTTSKEDPDTDLSKPQPNVNTENPDQSTSEPEPDPKVVQYEGENPNELEELTGSITYISVEQGGLRAGVLIDQYLESEGTCVLSLVNGDNQRVAEVSGIARSDITTSICELPELSVVDLPSGDYQVLIKINADSKTGTVKQGVRL